MLSQESHGFLYRDLLSLDIRDPDVPGPVRDLTYRDVATATLSVLHGLARRWQQLHREVRQIDRKLEALIKATAPNLVALRGVGADVAGALLVAVGDNPERLNHESSFASLCGVSPIDASSDRQHRHRLNRGGNRDANRALWVIAFVRLRSDPRRTFSTIKTELFSDRIPEGLDQMRRELFEYIEACYNRKRLHSSLGYITPVEKEALARKTLVAA